MKIEYGNDRRYKIIDWRAAGREVGPGWSPIANYFVWYVAQRGYRIAQIKEKWGQLRIYVNGPNTDWVYELLRQIEDISGEICERCGTNNASVTLGPRDPEANFSWIKTLCERCRGTPPEWGSKWRDR